MRAFLVGHLFNKMTDTLSRFVDVLIVVEMNLFRLESSDEAFSIPVLPRTPANLLQKSQCYDAAALRHSGLKDIEHLDQSDGSLGRFDLTPLVAGSTSEIASNAD